MYGLLGLDNIGWNTTIWKSGIWGSKKNQNIEKIFLKNVSISPLKLSK